MPLLDPNQFLLSIDSSSYDTCSGTNWRQFYDAGGRAATIRAATTDNNGNPIPDKMHVINMFNTGALGILRQPYGWLDPHQDGTKQGLCFVDHRIPGELPDMLDLEDSGYITAWGYNIEKRIRAWLDVVESDPFNKGKPERQPIIYTNPSYIKSYLSKMYWLSKYRIFIANYDNVDPSWSLPWTPVVWGWQYTKAADGVYYGFDLPPNFRVRQVALSLVRKP